MRVHEAAPKLIVQERVRERMKVSSYCPVALLTRAGLALGWLQEEWVGELRNVACHRQGLTNWRGGRGKSGLVSFETWHITNEDSLPGGEKVGEVGW